MNYKTCRWSKEEETQLLEYVNDEVSWEDISRELQRSIPACKNRVKKIDKRIIEGITEAANSIEEETAKYLDGEELIDFDESSNFNGLYSGGMIKEVIDFMEKNKSLFNAGGETNMELWTPERDLDLLIHFYA